MSCIFDLDFLHPSLKDLRDYIEGKMKHKQNELGGPFNVDEWIYVYDLLDPWKT